MDALENWEVKPISTKLKLLLLNLAELGKNYNPKPSDVYLSQTTIQTQIMFFFTPKKYGEANVNQSFFSHNLTQTKGSQILNIIPKQTPSKCSSANKTTNTK